ESNELQPLLQALQESIINISTTILQNPQVARTKGRPPSASNYRTDIKPEEILL
ncbi:16118_t:CDS:2, partial [Dentiscutata heterogama]